MLGTLSPSRIRSAVMCPGVSRHLPYNGWVRGVALPGRSMDHLFVGPIHRPQVRIE